MTTRRAAIRECHCRFEPYGVRRGHLSPLLGNEMQHFEIEAECRKCLSMIQQVALKRRQVAALQICLVLLMVGCTHPKMAKPPTPVVVNERLVIAYNGEDGKTALEILKSRAQVRTSTSSLGELVEEINGVKGNDHEHLLFFVNGQMSKVGAGGYVTKAADRIEWKLVSHGGNK